MHKQPCVHIVLMAPSIILGTLSGERELRAALYQMQETRQREQRLNEEFIMRREKQQAVELQDLAREHERLRAADAKNFEGQLRVQVDKHRNSHMALQAQIQVCKCNLLHASTVRGFPVG
jgi:hypothetical protein